MKTQDKKKRIKKNSKTNCLNNKKIKKDFHLSNTSSVKNVKVEWEKMAKPKDGEIEISDYTITKSGNKYDKNNAVFGIIEKEEIDIGTWFKNKIWGDVKIQRGIMWPKHERSADLLVLNNCPFLDEQTVEIKTISNAKNIKSVTTRLRKGKGQSDNILLDITNSSLNKSSIIKRAKNYINDSDWLKVLIIKNNSDYYVYKK